jgi:hypothetical protein
LYVLIGTRDKFLECGWVPKKQANGHPCPANIKIKIILKFTSARCLETATKRRRSEILAGLRSKSVEDLKLLGEKRQGAHNHAMNVGYALPEEDE